MKSYEDFKESYNEELFAELLVLDGTRRAMLTKCISATLILIFIAGLAPLFLLTGLPKKILLILISWAVCTGLWYLTIKYFTRYYRGDFKYLVINKLVKFIDPNLSYAPGGSIPEYIFRRAGIFERYINELSSEDFVGGMIGNTEIKFSEIHAQYEEEEEGGGELTPKELLAMLLSITSLISALFLRRDHRHTIFKGLFFVADFHKTFHGQVLVLPDKAEKYFGRFGSMLQFHNFTRDELMKMDNVEFEKEFVVYGTDQILARYVLTPLIMDKILELKKKTKTPMFLSLKDSLLYIAVPYKKNLFEPPYFRSLVDYIGTCRYFQDLTTFIGIVEEFNLNTRIWTKE
jgi:hypothetical protein